MAKRKVIRKRHEGRVTNEDGEVLEYIGRQPSVGVVLDLQDAAEIVRANAVGEGEEQTDEQRQASAEASTRTMRAFLQVVETINGNDAREYTFDDLNLCVGDLLDFFGQAAKTASQRS